VKQKYFTTLCLLVTAALFLSGCQTGSVNPEITWPVYENPNYGYAFNYPPDCIYGPLPEECKGDAPEEKSEKCLCFLNPENPDRVLMQTYHRDAVNQLILAEFQIVNLTWFADNPPTATGQIPDWLAETFPEHFDEAAFEHSEIDGVPVVSTTAQASEMAPAIKEIYFVYNGHLFQIRLLNPDEEKNSQLYDSILASFHFD